MKNTKKLLIAVLALVMVITVFAVPVAAEDVAAPAAAIGDASYATLQEALATAVEGQTVDLKSSIEVADMSGLDYAILIDKGITLNGNGNTVTYTGTGRAINVDTNGQVRIENLNIVCTGGADRGVNIIQKPVNLTLDTLNVSGASYAVKSSGSADGIQLSINNSTISGFAALAFHNNAAVTVTNSHLTGTNSAGVGSGAYGVIVIEGGLVTVDVSGGTVTAAATQNPTDGQTIGLIQEVPMNAGSYIKFADSVTLTKVNEGDPLIYTPAFFIPVEGQYYAGRYCTSLQTAIDTAISEGIGTVQLLQNSAQTVSAAVPVGAAITLDLNGFTLSYTSTTANTSELIRNQGTLVIQDSVGGGKITSVATNPDTSSMPYYANNTIKNEGHLTILGGTVECGSSGGACYAVDNNSTNQDATLIVNGGNLVHSANKTTIRLFANSTVNKNIVKIQSGLVEGSRPIWIHLPGSSNQKKLAAVEISGGTVRSTDTEYNQALYSYSYGDDYSGAAVSITGGTIAGDVALGGGSANGGSNAEVVTVTGGNFTGAYGVYTYNANAENITISGGSFAAEPEADYIAADMAAGYSEAAGAWIVHTHNSDTVVSAVDPSCTESGSKAGTKCSVCGKVMSGCEEIQANGHTLSKVDAGAATCTETGTVEHYKCSVCNKLYNNLQAEKELSAEEVIIPVAAHTLVKVDADAATCTETGTIEHYKCSVCEKLYNNAQAEKELAASETVAPVVAHTLSRVDAKAATCVAAGNIEHYKCSVCEKLFNNAQAEKELSASEVATSLAAHTLDEGTVTTAATCVAKGVKTYKCTVAGCTHTATEEIAATGHTLVKVEAKAATYTEAGNVEYYACACGALFADAEGKTATTADAVVIPQLIKIEGAAAKVETGAVDQAIEEAAKLSAATGEKTEVVVEIKDAETEENKEEVQSVVQVELPVESLKTVAEKKADLTVVLPTAAVTMDTEALKSVTAQAAGSTVTLVVKKVDTKTLTAAQQETIKKYNVAAAITAELICQQTGQRIWTEEANKEVSSGSVTVKIPFTPAENTKGSDYAVVYVADNGDTKKIEATYAGGYLVFNLEHFSDYIIVNENKTPMAVTPATGDDMNIVFLFALLAIAAAGVVCMGILAKKHAYQPKH